MIHDSKGLNFIDTIFEERGVINDPSGKNLENIIKRLGPPGSSGITSPDDLLELRNAMGRVTEPGSIGSERESLELAPYKKLKQVWDELRSGEMTGRRLSQIRTDVYRWSERVTDPVY